METEKIIFWRNLFFKTFVIGVLIAILFFIITVACLNTWLPWAENLFKLDGKEIKKSVFDFFLNMRIVILFFLLAPALALHWTTKKTVNNSTRRQTS